VSWLAQPDRRHDRHGGRHPGLYAGLQPCSSALWKPSPKVTVGALIAYPTAALILPLAGSLVDRCSMRMYTAFSILCATLSYFRLANLSGSVRAGRQ